MTPIALIIEDSSAVSTGAEAIASDSQLTGNTTKPGSLQGRVMPNERSPLVVEKGESLVLPELTFTRAISSNVTGEDGQPKQLPQAIAHRGYKSVYPENTMCAFKAAVEIGAHAIETDLHLSKDGVVVLSHDGTLKRCFGIDKKINECTWEYLSTLRTLKEPHVPMPRLSDLLEYLATPEAEHLWILLDVKRDDDPEEILTLSGQTIEKAETARCKDTGEERDWKDRVVFGGWNEEYISLITSLLPGFGAMHIGFNVFYARRFLKIPNVGFNMLQKVLVGPFGSSFMRDVRAADRPLVVWTVNEEEWMEWSIGRKVDGVITDDPKLFLEVRKRWEEDEGEEEEDGEVCAIRGNGKGGRVGKKTSLRMRRRKTSMGRKVGLYAEVAWLQILACVLGFFFLKLWKAEKRR